jgi:hypothetical protein
VNHSGTQRAVERIPGARVQSGHEQRTQMQRVVQSGAIVVRCNSYDRSRVDISYFGRQDVCPDALPNHSLVERPLLRSGCLPARSHEGPSSGNGVCGNRLSDHRIADLVTRHRGFRLSRF